MAWIGDGNNMCNTYVQAAVPFDFQLRIACPEGFEPKQEFLDSALAGWPRDPRPATRTKRWPAPIWSAPTCGPPWARKRSWPRASSAFAPYQVSRALLDAAAPDVLFMHCLPAHRGEEISTDLLDDPRSVAWDQAENRLHAQKALLEFLVEHAYCA